MMTKRPEKGLLAGLWEFPSIIFEDNLNAKEKTSAVDSLLNDYGIPKSVIAKRKYVGEVILLNIEISLLIYSYNLLISMVDILLVVSF